MDFKAALKTSEDVRQIFVELKIRKEYPIKFDYIILLHHFNEGMDKATHIKQHLKESLGEKQFAKFKVEMSKKISFLEENGYLVKTAHCDDKRKLEIQLTDKARSLLNDVMKDAEALWKEKHD